MNGKITDQQNSLKTKIAFYLNFIVSLTGGGAPTSDEILNFFMALGIWLQDVYGQTEGHGTTSFATRDSIRFGSAGKPYPMVKVRIADDGEILVKGDNVSPGYYKDPVLTRETYKDGWLQSGGLGRIDEDGYLWVTGRKKDIIITSGGKNITPSKIESSLMSLPLVEYAIVVGEGKKYLSTIISLNTGECEKIGLQPDIAYHTNPKLPFFELTVTRTHIIKYVSAGGDFQPIHHDEEYAKSIGLPSIFANGMMQGSMLTKVFTQWAGPANIKRYKIRFSEIVWPKDTLTFKGHVSRKYIENSENLVECALSVTNQNGGNVIEGEVVISFPA